MSEDGTSTTGDDAFQIVLLADGLAVHIPYWYDGDDARRVLARVWTVLDVVQQAMSTAPFDPQLGRTLVLDRDFEEVVGAYSGTAAFTATLVGASGAGAEHEQTMRFETTRPDADRHTGASAGAPRSRAWLVGVLVFEALVLGALVATGTTAPALFVIPVAVAVWAVWRTLPR